MDDVSASDDEHTFVAQSTEFGCDFVMLLWCDVRIKAELIGWYLGSWIHLCEYRPRSMIKPPVIGGVGVC